MVRLGRGKSKTARSEAHERRLMSVEVRISPRPWTSEFGNALADDICRR